jgi:hypothetical protein
VLALKRVLLIALFFLSAVAGTNHVAALPLFSETGKQAVFLSPMERGMPTWDLEGYVFQLERAGYRVDVLFDENVSISFLKTGLANYDIIILRTDSFDDEGVSYYCSGEPVTTKTRTTFAAEISSGELQVGACVGFTVAFLKHNYPANSLRPGLVFAIGGLTAGLSSLFLEGGCSAFVGYNEILGSQWGRLDALSIGLLRYLSQGYTLKDALNELDSYIHWGHGNSATWPSLYWRGDGDFKI